LRNLAAAKHGIKSAALLRKPDVLERLKHHFQEEHGLDMRAEEPESSHDVSPISQTIDKLRSRIKVWDNF
jgi:predicted small metal-binding protein